MSRLVVGVDGGGTKTHVVVADEKGAELSSVSGSASAVVPGEAEHSAEVIERLVREALAACERGEETPAAMCVGVAGVGRDAEFTSFFHAISAHSIADELEVLPDAVVALEDAFADEAGIILIAGTGSVCYGRGPTGRLARCGGWGHTAGDEGSGSWIGRRALSVVTASSDGREPDTALLGALLTHLELESADELVPWAAAANPALLAQLAAPVMAVAIAGDLRANSLCAMAAEELALHVRTLARQLFTDERATVPVAVAGGLMQRGSYLRKLVELRLKSAVPGVVMHHEDVVPARGAVRIALRMLAGV